jgi:DNA polymerase III sliding clamp (beta) subunit (PCNA family)
METVMETKNDADELRKELQKDVVDEAVKEKKVVKKTVKKSKKPKSDVNIKIEGDKSIWLDMIKRVSAVNDEIVLEISQKGLHIREIDVAHVSLVDMIVPKSAFKTFKANPDIKIGIELSKLTTHLKIFRNEITFNYDGGNNILLEGDKGKHSKMCVLSVNQTEIKIPNLEHSIDLKTKAENIKKMISVGEDFGEDHLRFAIRDGMFHIFVESETDEVRFPICAINKLNDCKDFFSIYSIDYLNSLFNFGIYDEITLKFARNKPLQVEYDDKTQKVLYLLAPRIESE